MSDIFKCQVIGEEWHDSEGLILTLWLEKVELDRLLAAYDPNSGTSPSVSEARPVLRAILNAVFSSQGG